MPDSSSKAWHRKKVEQIFHDYDYNKLGEVSLHDLQKSFAEMNMAIDAETFGQYKQGLLASNCDSVDLKSFVAFHQAVWENQPPAVRRFAGCPEVVYWPFTQINDSTAGSEAWKPQQRPLK